MGFFKFLNKNILYLSSLCLFVTGSLAVSIQSRVQYKIVEENPQKFVTTPLPILSKNSQNFPVFTAHGVYAIDLDSSVVLYEKNPDQRLYPASTTKIVTALVAMNYFKLDDVINTGTFNTIGQKMGLVWHENIKFEDLLYGLLIHSGNDAAEVIADNYPGGKEAFIQAMNEKAHTLSANNTQFRNPAGLDNIEQFTTARDLVTLSREALKDPEFSKVVSTKSVLAKSIDGKIAHDLSNRNELLGKVQGVLGVKTGWTEGARENLVTYVDRDNHRVLLAILGSTDRFGETKELVEWIFANYQWNSVDSIVLSQK